jgi:hypothetical protein
LNFGSVIIVFFFVLLLQIPASSYQNDGIDYPSGDWNSLATIHFEIIYPAGHEGLALRAAGLAERGYIRVSDYLGHETAKIITIIIYPSNHVFQRDDVYDTASGAGDGILTIPFSGSYPEFQRTMTRELVFAFQHDILSELVPGMTKLFAIHIPLWFSLGLAEYIAYGYDAGTEMAMHGIVRGNRYAGIRDLSETGGCDLAECRRVGRAFFFFLEKQYGRVSIGEMLANFGSMGGIDDAVYAGTGKTVEEIDHEWMGFIVGRYKNFKKKHRGYEKRIGSHEGVRLAAATLISAVSHDGAKIACLADRGATQELIILAAEKKPDNKKAPFISRSFMRGRFESEHPADNNITWTGDNKSIVLAARANGREYIYFINPDSGRTQYRIPLPFSAVMYPSVSRDGRRIVFTGIAGSSEDIYIYDRDSEKTIRVTDDDFSDRYPLLAPDGRSAIYSSNWNPEGDVARNKYAIYRRDLESGKRTMLVPGGGNNIQPDITPDGNKILYVSDRSGIYNAYVYDLLADKGRRVTDSLEGIFHPRWFPDGRSFACVAYSGEGYDLLLKDGKGGVSFEKDTHGHEEIKAVYHTSYVDPSRYYFSTYHDIIKPSWFHVGGAGTLNNAYLCFLQFGMSDYLGRHRLVLTSSYSHESQNRNHDINADAAYYYMSRRWNVGLGMFRQASPNVASSIGVISNWKQQCAFGLISMEHYGGYASAGYSFSRFVHLTLRTDVSRYEKLYPDWQRRTDLRATAGNISRSIVYDNVIQGAMVPVNGFTGRLQAEQCIDFTGGNSFSSANIDMQGFILIGRRFMIALRGAAGSVIGKNRWRFNFFLGGYDTLRGYDMLSLSGRHMLLVNAEFRIAGHDWLTFGLPLSGGLGNAAAVVFIDAGSAWNGRVSMSGGKSGDTDGFKMDFGFGIRFALYPALIFKLDFAWPFDKKSIKKNDILFSAGFMY